MASAETVSIAHSHRDVDAHRDVDDAIDVGQWCRWIVAFTVAIVGFGNTIDINMNAEGPHEEVGVDLVVVSKLLTSMMVGLIGAVGLVTMPTARAMLLRGPGLVLVVLGGVFVATSAFAPPEVATVSRITSVLVLVYLGFAAVALQTLGLRRLAMGLMLGLIVNVIGNWIIYLFLQPVGIFIEDLGNGIEVKRMGGLGHPNAIARLAVTASIIVAAASKWWPRDVDDRPLGGGWWWMGCIHVATLATICVTVSRTAVIAGVAAAVAIYARDWWTRRGLGWISLAAGALLILAVGYMLVATQNGSTTGGSIVATVTKTGDVDELTSATGRTTIWAEAIRLIRLRPWTGYGLNSSPVLMAEYSFHTHNVILHALFSGGVLAGLLVLMLLIWNLLFSLFDADPLVRGMAAFLLVSCLFEDTVLETFAGPSTLMWFIILLVPAWRIFARAGYNTAVDDMSIAAT